MNLPEEKSLTCVLDVPLEGINGKYNYGEIRYSPDLQWTNDDKVKLEELIDNLINSLDTSGEEKIIISGSEVIIRYEIHLQDEKKRIKLVKGFIEKVVSENVSVKPFSLISLLKEVSPESFRRNKEAINYLEILDTLVNNSEDKNSDSQLHLFKAILQILSDNKDKYTNDKKSAERLSNVVDNLKTLCLDI